MVKVSAFVRVLAQYDEIKGQVYEDAMKYRQIKQQLSEAAEQLKSWKEPDFGPVETFDDAPAPKSNVNIDTEELKSKIKYVNSDEFEQAQRSYYAGLDNILKKKTEALNKYNQEKYTEALTCYNELIELTHELNKQSKRITADIKKNQKTLEKTAAAEPISMFELTLLNSYQDSHNKLRDINKSILVNLYMMKGCVKLKLNLRNEALHGFKDSLKYDPPPEMLQYLQDLITILQDDSELEQVKAELEKYKSLGKPEELKKAVEQIKEGEDNKKRLEDKAKAHDTLNGRLDDAIEAIKNHKPQYKELEKLDLEKLFD